MNTGDTKTHILAAAIAAYGRVGSHGFSMRVVAAEAGITATAIYRHFADKEALVQAMVERARAIFAGYLFEGISGADSLERLWSCARSYVRFALEYPRLYQLLFLDPINPTLPNVHDIGENEDAKPFRFVVDRIREAMAHGFIRKGVPEEAALSIWAHIHGLCALAFAGRIPNEELQATCARSLSDLLAGLSPRSD